MINLVLASLAAVIFITFVNDSMIPKILSEYKTRNMIIAIKNIEALMLVVLELTKYIMCPWKKNATSDIGINIQVEYC